MNIYLQQVCNLKSSDIIQEEEPKMIHKWMNVLDFISEYANK